jgi:hypothetical protein
VPPPPPTEPCECYEEENKRRVKYIDVTVPIVACVYNPVTELFEPERKQTTVKALQVDNGTEAQTVKEQFERLAQIQADLCVNRNVTESEGECIAAVPDWWPTRADADRPQLVLIFRRRNQRDYYELCIPHPRSTQPPSSPPIANYQKGNIQGMVTLRDNSKFICYAVSTAEAQRLCNIAVSLIDPNYLTNPPMISFTERRGYLVAVDEMIANSAQYFSTGQRNLKPDWRKAFNGASASA